MLYENFGIKMSPEGGGSGGTTTPAAAANTTANPAGQPGTTPGGQNGATPDPGQTQPAAAAKTFTQEELEKAIGERLERERKKAEKETQDRERQAELARLESQKEFEKLAEERANELKKKQSRIEELETAAARVEKMDAALSQYRDILLANVPESVKTLLEKQPVEDQLEWLTQNSSQFQGSGQPAQTPPAIPLLPNYGNPPQLNETQKRQAAYRPGL